MEKRQKNGPVVEKGHEDTKCRRLGRKTREEIGKGTYSNDSPEIPDRGVGEGIRHPWPPFRV